MALFDLVMHSNEGRFADSVVLTRTDRARIEKTAEVMNEREDKHPSVHYKVVERDLSKRGG